MGNGSGAGGSDSGKEASVRLFRTAEEERSGLWKRALDLALTDVRVLAGGLDHETLEQLEERPHRR